MASTAKIHLLLTEASVKTPSSSSSVTTRNRGHEAMALQDPALRAPKNNAWTNDDENVQNLTLTDKPKLTKQSKAGVNLQKGLTIALKIGSPSNFALSAESKSTADKAPHYQPITPFRTVLTRK